MGFWINFKLFCCLSLVLVTEQRNIVKRELETTEDTDIFRTPQKHIIEPVQTLTKSADDIISSPYDAVDFGDQEKFNEIENKNEQTSTDVEGNELIINKNCENEKKTVEVNDIGLTEKISNDLNENIKELNVEEADFAEKNESAEKFHSAASEVKKLMEENLDKNKEITEVNVTEKELDNSEDSFIKASGTKSTLDARALSDPENLQTIITSNKNEDIVNEFNLSDKIKNDNALEYINKNTQAGFSEKVEQKHINDKTEGDLQNSEKFEQFEKNKNEQEANGLEINTKIIQNLPQVEYEKEYNVDTTTVTDSENFLTLSDDSHKDFVENHVNLVKISFKEESDNESKDSKNPSKTLAIAKDIHDNDIIFPKSTEIVTPIIPFEDEKKIQENDIIALTTPVPLTYNIPSAKNTADIATESPKASETLSPTTTPSIEATKSTTTTAKPVTTRRPFINRRPTRRPTNTTNPGWFPNFPLVPPGLFFPTFFLNPFNTTISANNQTQTTFGFGIFTLPSRWRPNLGNVFRPLANQANSTAQDSRDSFWNSLFNRRKSANADDANNQKENETSSWSPWNYITGNEIPKTSTEKSQLDNSAVNTQVLHLYFPLRYPFQGPIVKETSVNAKSQDQDSKNHIVEEQAAEGSPDKSENHDFEDLNKLKTGEKASLKFEFELPKPIAKFVKGVIETFMPQQN